MLIKQTNKQNPFLGRIHSLIRPQRRIGWVVLLGLAILLASSLALASFYFGVAFQQAGFSHILNAAVQSRAKKLSIIPNYFRGRVTTPERIAIDIRHIDFEKLAYKRKIALEKRILIASPDDYVPARIRYKDRTLRAKVRLKGDLIDQLRGQKWPLRIVIKGENTLFGMKVFSIHEPKQRGYLYEWLVHKAMKREGVIALRYDFINVTMNGKDLGLYALEEHFEKLLIEDNQRREGPIVAFSEEKDIENIGHFGTDPFGWPGDKRIDFYSANIDVYRPAKTLADPLLREQFMIAKNLLESFRLGRLRASDIFDYEILARYLALLDLFNARHAAKYGNLKFYYNPVTAKLEPIFFDAEIFTRESDFEKIYAEDWFEDRLNPTRLYFEDQAVFELYMQELVRISDVSYLDSLFDEIDDELKRTLNKIHSENPAFYFDKDLFYSKASLIRQVLALPSLIHAYFKGYLEENGEKNIELHVSNIRPIPVRIIHASLSDGISFPAKGAERIVQPSFPGKPVNTEKVKFIIPQDFKWKAEYAGELTVQCALLGLETTRSAKVFPWADFDQDFIENDFVRRGHTIQEFDFLQIDEAAKKITIKSGDHTLGKSLIIPRGYKVGCGPNTQLNLMNSAKIVSYSALDFIGSEGNPIMIHSKDSTGQGIAVIHAGQKTTLKHVIFDNLSNPSQGGWSLTGAVTFYESPVEMYNCQFTNSKSEDGLNIVRSYFSIHKCLFEKTFSDAIDVDFGRGKITDSSFRECGNDAIDASGSTVELRNISINGAGDKGLSVGENSKAAVGNIEIKNAKTAIASKDLSRVTMDGAEISNCKTGLSVYRKKSEFGPASITARGLQMHEVDMFYLVEEDSRLTIEGKKVTSHQGDIRELLSKY